MDTSIKNSKITISFALFAELANARIEANNARIEANNARIEANNLKIEVAQYKRAIKEILAEIVKNSDVENNSFYKENAMPFPLFPDTDKVCKVSDTKCVIIKIGGRNNGE